VEGAFGCCFPIRPMLMLPGMPIDVQMVREVGSDVDHDRLIRAVTMEAAGTTYDENWTAGITGDFGYASNVQFKYGQLTIGLMYRGLQLTPRCCIDWYYNFGYWQAPAMGEDVVQRRLEQYAKSLGMKLPNPLDPRAGVPVLSGFDPGNKADMQQLESYFDSTLRPVGNKDFQRLGTIDPYAPIAS